MWFAVGRQMHGLRHLSLPCLHKGLPSCIVIDESQSCEHDNTAGVDAGFSVNSECYRWISGVYVEQQ